MSLFSFLVETQLSITAIEAGELVTFTLKLTNTGNVSLSDILTTSILDDLLLNPIVIIQPDGTSHTLYGNSLLFAVEYLAVGESIEIVFTAIISDDVPEDAVLSNTTDASVGGNDNTEIEIVENPPENLPPSGGGDGGVGGAGPDEGGADNTPPPPEIGPVLPPITQTPEPAPRPPVTIIPETLPEPTTPYIPWHPRNPIYVTIPPTNEDNNADETTDNKTIGEETTEGDTPNNEATDEETTHFDTAPELTPHNPMPLATTHFAYMVGFPEDGSIRPEANITRAEVSTIFFRLISDAHRINIWSQTNSFEDVTPTCWSNNPVSTMENGGLFKGIPLGATFNPTQHATRAEFAAMVVNYMGFGHYRVNAAKEASTGHAFADIADHWAADAIGIAHLQGWITGFDDGTFRPDQPITRAEVAALINRALGRLPQTAEDLLPGMLTWTDNLDIDAWYYLYIQEASNCNHYETKEDGIYKTWVELAGSRRWTALEQPDSTPWCIID